MVFYVSKVLLCCSLTMLTGGKTMVGALRLVARPADGFHRHGVVGATGDASHYALGFQSVALGITSRRCQRGNVGLGPNGG